LAYLVFGNFLSEVQQNPPLHRIVAAERRIEFVYVPPRGPDR
jgi:hypothetical protein